MSAPTTIRACITGRLMRDPQMPGPASNGGAARLLVQAQTGDGTPGPVVRLKADERSIIRFLADMRPVKGDSLMATGILTGEAGEDPWMLVDVIAFATSLDQKDTR